MALFFLQEGKILDEGSSADLLENPSHIGLKEYLRYEGLFSSEEAYAKLCLNINQQVEFFMEKLPMTAGGLQRLQDELKHLKNVERYAVIKAISEAREHGDLSENAEYHSARERQGFIEGRIHELEDRIARAEVIDVSKLSGTDIKFGATVTLIDEETEEKITYQIVGVDESDIKKGLLSINAPLARALIGKSIGDTCDITTPGKGHKSYEILEVSYS